MLDDKDEFEPVEIQNPHLRRMFEKYSGRGMLVVFPDPPPPSEPYQFENPHLKKLAEKYLT